MISTTVWPGLSSSVGRHCQEFSKRALRLRVVDALVVGQHHRDQAGVARALHVVLAAQRMQAGAGLADLAGDSDSAIRQRALSVPCTCWLMPMPHRIIEPLRVAYSAPPRGSSAAAMPQIGAIASGL